MTMPTLALTGRNRSHRSVLLAAALLGVLAGSCMPPGPRLVVLIVVDTLRADRLGCYGCESVETPNIDRLAAEGVLYENALSAVPVTLPSMSTLLTGAYPLQHGVRDNGSFRLPDSWDTLPEQLRRSGFATGAFVSAAVLDPEYNLDQGFDVYDADVSMTYEAFDPLVRSTQSEIQGLERRAEITVDRALAWLEDQRGDTFLLVHLFDPHLPRDPPPPYDRRYRGRPYDGEVAYVDAEVGRFLDGVDEIWRTDEVLCLFVADHGEGLGDHDEWFHGDLLFEETMRVPLIVRGTGLPEGERIPDLVRTADVAPTLARLLDLDPPTAAVGQTLPGLGMEEWNATGREIDTPRFRSTAYLETFRPRLTHGWCEMRGLRTDRWKLIAGPEYELYDLASDPGETRNVATDFPAVRDSLARSMDRVALLAARRGAAEAEAHALDPEEAEQLESLGYVTPRRHPLEDATAGASPESLAVWIYPPHERGTALDLPHPRERLGAAQNRIVARSYYLAAVAELEAGRFEEAAKRFRAAFERSPEFTDAYLGFARAAKQAGQTEAALDCLEIAAAKLPRSGEIAAQLARSLLQRGRVGEARDVLTRARRSGAPDSLLDVVEEEVRRARPS